MRKIFFLLLLNLIAINFTDAQVVKHFKAEAKPSKVSVKAKERFTIDLKVKFDKGWHTYGMQEGEASEEIGPLPTEISLEPASKLALKGKVKAPKGKKEYDKEFQMDVIVYEGELTFTIPVEAKKDINFETEKINVVFTVQQCDKSACLPPEGFKIPIKIEDGMESVKDDSKNTESVDTTTSETITPESNKDTSGSNNSDRDNVDKELSDSSGGSINDAQSIWAVILVAAAGGAASLLMPCVFPMVPITVSFFTKRFEQKKGKGIRDALVYALGIIFTFTAFGMIVSLIFGASEVQNISNSPWVNLFITVIFIAFALSLFGAFEIQLPSGLLNKLNAKSQQGGGIFSVLLMGLTFSLASFSCTGPIVGASLAAAAKGSWFYPLISMLVYSTVLSAPFFLLALFPKALSSMPRAGGWMNNIKTVLAFLLIASCAIFLNNALISWDAEISRELFLSIWIACALLSFLYILGVFKMTHDSPVESIGIMRVLFAAFFLTITVFLVNGMFGKSLGFLDSFVPISKTADEVTINKEYTNYEEALAAAKKEGLNIFLDFTGKHCKNCKNMEATMFPRPAVAAAMSKMIKVKLITDVPGEEYEKNKQLEYEMFNTVALPLYAIVSPDGKVIATTAYTSSETEFVEFLKKGIKK